MIKGLSYSTHRAPVCISDPLLLTFRYLRQTFGPYVTHLAREMAARPLSVPTELPPNATREQHELAQANTARLQALLSVDPT